jgi:hypothetical protein
MKLFFCIEIFLNITNLCLAAYSGVLFFNQGFFFACKSRYIIIFPLLFIIYKISNVDQRNHRVIGLNWDIFLLPCNDPVWKFISLLEFLMMTPALQCRFCLNKFFHFLEKGIGPKLGGVILSDEFGFDPGPIEFQKVYVFGMFLIGPFKVIFILLFFLFLRTFCLIGFFF